MPGGVAPDIQLYELTPFVLTKKVICNIYWTLFSETKISSINMSKQNVRGLFIDIYIKIYIYIFVYTLKYFVSISTLKILFICFLYKNRILFKILISRGKSPGLIKSGLCQPFNLVLSVFYGFCSLIPIEA